MNVLDLKITKTEFMALMGDAISETLDAETIYSKKQSDKDWFERLNNIVEYILYNEFNIEVVK